MTNPPGNLFFAGCPELTAEPSEGWKEMVSAGATLEQERFVAWVLGQAGLEMNDYRLGPLLRRVAACLRAVQADSLEAARARLERHPGLLTAAVSALLLGVSEFCRDALVFDVLRSGVLPSLLRQSGRIRVWSAACSDGQELYSIALLLDQVGALERAELLGTDCRADAIRRAQSGSFSTRVATPALRLRGGDGFFSRGESQVRVTNRIRTAPRWRVSNVLRETMPGPWDVVLCRNLAIYLQPEAADRMWAQIAEEVRPGGFLVTGRADFPAHMLQWHRVSECIHQKPENDNAQ